MYVTPINGTFRNNDAKGSVPVDRAAKEGREGDICLLPPSSQGEFELIYGQILAACMVCLSFMPSTARVVSTKAPTSRRWQPVT